MSLLNALAGMGSAVSDYAAHYGAQAQANEGAMNLLQRRSELEAEAARQADAMATTRASAGRAEEFGYNTRLKAQENVLLSAREAANRAATLQAQKDLATFTAGLPTPDERFLTRLLGGSLTGTSPATPATGPAPPATGGGTGTVDQGGWDTGTGPAPPPVSTGPATDAATSPPTATAAPGGPTIAGLSKEQILSGFIHEKYHIPQEGSEAANRTAIIQDIVNDPANKDLTPGQRAAMVETRIAGMKAIERTGTYKFEAATAPDPDDPSGKNTIPGFMRFNLRDGTSQFLPTNTQPNKGAGAGMGSRSELYFDRMMKATNMAVAAAANIMELPADTSTGWFAGREQGHTLLGAVKEALVNNVTAQDVQSYNVMLSGLSRNLSAIESSGMAPTGTFTKSMGEGITLKEGDTQETKLRRMAEIRQIVTEGMRDVFDNPKVPQPQKDALRKTLDTLETVIPFTQHDLTELAKAKAGTTLTDIMRQKGLGQKPGGDPKSDPLGIR